MIYQLDGSRMEPPGESQNAGSVSDRGLPGGGGGIGRRGERTISEDSSDSDGGHGHEDLRRHTQAANCIVAKFMPTNEYENVRATADAPGEERAGASRLDPRTN